MTNVFLDPDEEEEEARRKREEGRGGEQDKMQLQIMLAVVYAPLVLNILSKYLYDKNVIFENI